MKTSRLKRVRREEEKRNRDKPLTPKQWKIIAAVCGTVFAIALCFFSVDLVRAKKNNQPPIFCVPVIEYENGSEDYYGLFYKVWKDYNPFEDETRYYMGFWLLPKSVNI